MKYHYYPGCSLEETAREYDLSTRAVMTSMGAELMEIEDWGCCGAGAAEAISYLLSLALPARNLAIAEKQEDVAGYSGTLQRLLFKSQKGGRKNAKGTGTA